MKNEARKPNKFIHLQGMSWVRAYSACQALMAPTKFYGATHKRCREVIKAELGYLPKGKPGTEKCGDNGDYRGSSFNKGFRDGGNEAILDWLGVVHMEQYKEAGCILPSDETLLVVKDAS